jgi:2,3-bisphosphoglycerate-dependent phosphoglycerate mutase
MTIKDDRSRPLTLEGMIDTKEVTAFLNDKHPDFLISSSYRRSIDTIRDLADTLHMEIYTYEDFREREIGSGYNGNPEAYIVKMWADFNYKSEGAECLAEVQYRNLRAFKKVLSEHMDQTVVIATHGTALSTILNYYDPSYQFDDYKRILRFRPYIIRLDFDGNTYLGRTEELIIER